MEAKPLRAVPSPADTAGGGGGPQMKIEEKKKRGMMGKVEVCSGIINLGLGVGASDSVEEEEAVTLVKKKPLITEAQMLELWHQCFIFKHFESDRPVPHHLVLPILTSVAANTESGFTGICKQFPSLKAFKHDGFSYGSMVDHEPHRCRRTDGKKWRCRERVVPDQKYCQRHMHRGRNRSRKPVETSEEVNTSSLATKPSGNLHANSRHSTHQPIDPVLISNTQGIQLINPSILPPRSSHCNFDVSVANRCKNSLSSTAVPAAISRRNTESMASNDRSNLNFLKKDDMAKSCMIRHSNTRVRGCGNITNDGNFSTGIGFSPRSVLQGVTVSGCHHSIQTDRNNTELESGRCRRTDGKKWQCRNSALPDLKYCATHIHRGAKKRFKDPEPSTIPLGSSVTIAQFPSSAVTPDIQKAYHKIPNTNLCMSIPASASLALQCKEEKKSPSSSGTDTTISDTMNDYSYSYASFSEAASKLKSV